MSLTLAEHDNDNHDNDIRIDSNITMKITLDKNLKIDNNNNEKT